MKRLGGTRRKTIVAFGETLWDLLPGGAVLGGAPFNFAYRVNSLGDRGVIVTRLGTDEPGRKALEMIKALDMETEFVQRDDEHPTGTVQVTFDAEKNPDYVIVPDAAYDFVAPTEKLLALMARADCISFGTLAQRSTRTRRTLRQALTAARDKLKLLDVNLRRECFSPATIEESLDHADIVKMNLQEAHYLADLFEFSDPSLPSFCAEMIREWSLTHCLVTLGKHGVLALNRDGETVYEPGYAVAVKDSCGAGDAFSAGFIHAYLRKQPLTECCRFGNALGAMVAGQTGATAPIAPAEISAFLKKQHQRITEPSLARLTSGSVQK